MPQGSVLFIIFKNDLLKDIVALSFLVADETKLMQKPTFLTLKKKNEIQGDMNRLIEWSEKNELRFRTLKCKAMGMISQTHKPCLIQITKNAKCFS